MLEAWREYQQRHGLDDSHARTFLDAWAMATVIDPDRATTRDHAVRQAAAACNRSWPARAWNAGTLTFAGFDITRGEFEAEVERLQQLEKEENGTDTD